MSLEEKLKGYMTDTPVPEQLRPENIMSGIQSRLDALPKISDEESFIGGNSELNAIEFLTKLRRMGLSAEDFANLLRGNGVSEERIALLDENPFMSADELCDFLDSCGFTAQSYTKMLYLARKLWLQTQSLEHLDSELLIHAKNNAENASDNAETFSDNTEDISYNTEITADNTENLTINSENVATRRKPVSEKNDTSSFPEIENVTIEAAPERASEETTVVPELEPPITMEAKKSSFADEPAPIRESPFERDKVRPITRLKKIIEKVDDTAIIDGDELDDAEEAHKAALLDQKKQAEEAEKLTAEEQALAKTRRKNAVFKAISAAAAAVVIMFGVYEYVKLPHDTDITESAPPEQVQTEEPVTYEEVYTRISGSAAAHARTDGSGYMLPVKDTFFTPQTIYISEAESESDILLCDGDKFFYLAQEATDFILYSLHTTNGTAEVASSVHFTAVAAEIMLVDDGICIVSADPAGGNTFVRILDKETFEVKRSAEISGKLIDMLYMNGKLTFAASYSPRPSGAYTSGDYDCYLPFYSADNSVKFVLPEDILLPESETAPCYAVVAELNPSAEDMLTSISACMMSADAVTMNDSGVLIAENSYPTSLLYFKGNGNGKTVLLNGTVGGNDAISLYGGKICAVSCLSTASATDKTTLYVFDGELNAVSRIENIASGETLNRAYFEENTAYIVTQRESNPLFTLDLTNPEKPIITGELKLPTFKTQRRVWGDDALLGFGEEVNEDGTLHGLKLSLVDITDRTTEKASLSITDIPDLSLCGTEASENASALYSDDGESLAGFMYSYFDGISTVNTYNLAKYADGTFTLIGSLNNYDLGTFRRGTVKDNILYAFTDKEVTCADAQTLKIISTCKFNAGL